jgi:hypothetical protein
MIALITGATAGIGKATAELLAKHDYDLILTGRRADQLNTICRDIEKSHQVKVKDLCFDVRDLQEVKKHISSLDDEWNKIDVLVNNAGLAAGLDFINEGNIDDWEQMIDTNIKGLLYVTREVSGFMIKNQKGHIVNISSIAGKEVYEKGNVYCSTKHAVEAITKGTRIDLLKNNVRVTSVSPGAVDTEFSWVRFKGDEEKAQNVYKGYVPLHAEDVAEAVLFAVTRPAHVNINDILIMPTAQASTCYTNKE